MKTREELFIEFQREFDKKRKRGIISLWWTFPLWIFMNSIFVFFLSLVIFPSSFGIQLDSNSAIVFLCTVLVIAMVLVNFICLWDFFEDYNIKKLIKQKGNYLSEKIKVRDESWRYRDLITVPNILPLKPVYNAESLSTWIMFGKKYGVNHDFEILTKLDEEISKQCKETHEAKIWLQVYEQTSEKTYWQYLWSWKWMKKINGKEENDYGRKSMYCL